MTVLNSIYERLSTNAAINAFVLDKYNKPLKHLFGFKQANKADDCPVLCYQVTQSNQPSAKNVALVSDFAVSLVLMVCDNRFLDADDQELESSEVGKADFLKLAGDEYLSSLTQLVVDALKTDLRLSDGCFISSDFGLMVELPPRFPFFSSEIVFTLKRGR